MPQPIIKLSQEPIDTYLLVLTVIGLFILFGLPLLQYDSLPDKIPAHYDATGKIDRYGDKNEIWALPLIGFLLTGFLFGVSRFPHIFNYPVKITNENAALQYKKATRLLKVLGVVIVFALSFIVHITIQNAKGPAQGMPIYFLPLLLLAIFGTIGYYLYNAGK